MKITRFSLLKFPICHHFQFDDELQFKCDLEKAVLLCKGQIEMSRPYATYEEAREAVQKLKIRNQKEYVGTGLYKGEGARYKEDPRLPAGPSRIYGDDWKGWSDFLRNEQKKEMIEPYATYDEAREAVQKLKIRSRREYVGTGLYKGARYKEDPRLPSTPHQIYGDDWKGWYDFLVKEERVKPYATYEEARKAVQKLKIRSNGEYQGAGLYKGKGARYKEDPRLPSAPHKIYGDAWKGWYDFLGTGKAGNY